MGSKTISRKPGKQRKRLYTAPWHRRHKLLTARLAPDLAEKYGVRRLPVRKGDTVLVCRGAFADSEGVVNKVDTKKLRLHIENITIEKTDGSIVPLPIAPCNVIITKLKMDKAREAMIARKVEAAKRQREKEE